ncbi:Nucleoporin nup184 [Ceratocystis platani]|uniref:Nucleoporin nup184 n=1 Tax=Ceratocystis fimbriata f. sp. platani TaxID=88771 RepID=A0A0F8BP28_CERFI|nr:Nucleoporin nup184 [Ceratocystis platani]
MAGTSSVYFPPLADCLRGEKAIISWKMIADALFDVKGAAQSSPVFKEFGVDSFVIKCMKEPATAFSPPNEAARADYEARTAAINISHGAKSKFNLDQIKADAAWLSSNARVNLDTALRVVVIEWQARASSQLSGPLSAQEIMNLQEASGGADALSTTLAATLRAQESLDTDDLAALFDKEETRRRRIFHTYLSERRSYALALDHMHTNLFYGTLPFWNPANKEGLTPYQPSDTSDITSKVALVETIMEKYLDFLSAAMDGAENYLSSLSNDSTINTEEMAADYQATLFAEMTHAISVIFQALQYLEMEYDGMLAAPSLITHWFALMAKGSFLEVPEPSFPVPSLYGPITTLVCATSLLLLNPRRALRLMNHEEDPKLGESPYFTSPETLEQIHNALLSAADGGAANLMPEIFVWTILLHRMHVSYVERNDRRDTIQQQKSVEALENESAMRPVGRRSSIGSIVSLETSSYDSFLVLAGIEKDVQLIEQLGQISTQHGVAFSVIQRMSEVAGIGHGAAFPPVQGARMRSVFRDFLTFTFPMVQYQSDNVEAMLSVVSAGSSYWVQSAELLPPKHYDPSSLVLEDPDAMEFFFQEAFNRYPLELVPFLRFCKALSRSMQDEEDLPNTSLVLDMLKNTPRVTFNLPEDFQDYELVFEDENTNSFQLLEPLAIIGAATRSRYGNAGMGFVIPAGSTGRFVSDSGRLVYIEYSHSALQLMGRRLQINYCRSGFSLLLGPMNEEEVAETVSLLASLLRTEHLKGPSAHLPQAKAYNVAQICEEISASMEGDRDILGVVCDIMDHYLQDDTAFNSSEVPPVLTACIEFLHATLDVYPSRVLSYLARCHLLPYQADGGKMGRFAGTVDIVPAQFAFLYASMRLFHQAIVTVMRSSVYRKCGPKLITRLEGSTDVWLGTANKVLSRVVSAISQGCVDILETSTTWRFSSLLSQSMLIESIVSVLNVVISSAYRIGDIGSANRLTSCMEEGAQYILKSFLSHNAGSLKMQHLIDTLTSAMAFPQATFFPREFDQICSRVDQVTSFHTNLLRCASLHDMSSEALQKYLFKTSFLLARLSAVNSSFKGPCLTLLEALVTAAGEASKEPPSLLGFLGAQSAKSFLDLLKDSGPFQLPSDSTIVWKFLTAVIRNKQQWMSNCLISGKTPREASSDAGKKSDMAEDSVFNRALTKLRDNITAMSDYEIIALLEFVTAAQNYWPWTVFTIMKDPSCLDSLRSYVRGLESASVTARTKSSIKAAFEARQAAYIAEAFAMQLYHLRHMKQATPLAEKLVQDLDYFLRDGATISGYNKSLHLNFNKNFANRYPGCTLEQFKRTQLVFSHLGPFYYYNLPMANAMLSCDRSWHGHRNNNGFKGEMERANLNLSLVDSQIALYHSWEFLLLELGSCIQSPVLNKNMVQVAQQCLSANLDNSGPENIFVRITESRANFALTLIQRVANTDALVDQAPDLLTLLLDSIKALQDPLSETSVAMYRTLLRALYIVLRACSNMGKKAEDVSVTQTILVVLDQIVGKGFRAVVTRIHEKDANVSPEDLALLTAALHGCLSVSGLEDEQSQIINILAAHDVVHVACSLFSWSDRITVAGDPVYGELSLLFLLELSKMSSIAEQMACDGIVSHLTSANITNFMRRSIISPFAADVASERCYTIWAKAMLPLLLNLLMAMGATVAPEISYVLNQFPSLMKASVERLEAPGASRTASKDRVMFIALLPVMEAHSLALITRILTGLRAANSRDIPEVHWDAASMLENVEFWLSSRRLLRERLVPLNPREAMARSEKAGNGAGLAADASDGLVESKLETQVVAEMEEIRNVLGELM